ncbi:M1 family metallopeptidase [Oleiagrimonas sp. MCCC 1A03011]|uniref:M1 family metallopeptidase n=1 Tax=Oleiagrimonas sp. MCCC 1A03011 TaxID=1926883 RepID=UPI000DC40DD7|nr:M1 family metallopeptidase [Oleiagrimonas sp. MCCC 1A03011]RAP59441.1 aminopeptidase [Oleiagrimonas sp. MCCC 1A03011]
MRRLTHTLAFTALAACFSSAFAGGADMKPPLERLPGWAVPEAYTLDLRVDPAQTRFAGVTTIRVELKKAADHVWMHGKDLKVSSVRVIDAKGVSHAAQYVNAAPKQGVVRIDFGKTLQPQELKLVFDYSAPFNHQLQGLYKVTRDGRPYAMTQMEPISARYAFPSFDEPGFKTPYKIVLTVPNDEVAVANTAIAKSSKDGKGWKTLDFKTTQPLPTYLVAFAVGPWDVVSGGEIKPNAWRKEPIRLRGIAPHGEGSRIHIALSETPVIIQTLEQYYGFGYPFGKLDLLAAPDFSAGAMENAGLVTFRDWLMLMDKNSPSDAVRNSFNVQAHELAHQWTGDTVTLDWWNDIWLNEAFATWMQQKVTAKVHPEYRADLDRVSRAEGAMGNDSLVSARKIRQPITGNGDIQTAFDGITYQKGAAVIGMFEHYVGVDTFRKGMRAYIQAHKFGNAKASDLVGAIDKAAGKGEAFKHAFNSFLDQSGVPMVSTRLDCSGTHPVLHLTQDRYLPLGSSGDPNRLWGIPVCVRTGAGKAGVQCQMLDSKTATMQLSGGQCPAWYMPNADARGYYRFSMDKTDLAKLNGHLGALNDAEKLAYADAVKAAFHRGDIDASAAMEAVRRLAPSKTRQVALAPLDTFAWIWKHEAQTDAQRAALRKLASEAYLPRLQKLGYVKRKGESSDDALTRSALAGFLGVGVKLPAVRAALLQQADRALEKNAKGRLNLAAANPDLLSEDLTVAVEEKGKPVVDALIAELNKTTDADRRNAMLAALSHAPGAQAERVWNFALSPQVKVGEMFRLLTGHRDTQQGRDALWTWFKGHYDQVVKRTGTFASGYVPNLAGGGGCSMADAERLQAFFTPRLDDLPGADRGLAQTTESIKLCAALKKAQDPSAITR